MKKPLIIIVLIIILLGGATFAWWTISPLFITTTLNEDIPVEAENTTNKPTETNDESAAVEITNTTTEPAAENKDVEIPTIITGNFIDGEHKVSGTVKIIESGEKKYLRFENFSTENGPDLRVYLASDTEANDAIDLGDLPATDGNYNIELPNSVDLTKNDTVLIWCRAFRVNFGSATLAEQ